MAVFSVIKLSELEGAKRIDAEYYDPEYLEVKQKLLKKKFVYFKNLVKEIIHPKEIKREYEEEKQDYLFLLAQNVRPLMFDLSEKKFISEEKAKLMPKNLLEKGDILFVRSGNVGDLTVYTGEPKKIIASSDLLIAKPTFKFSYYLGVFLTTNYGQKILIRGIYSGLQPHIAPSYIKTIPIPILPEEIIRRTEILYLKAQNLLKQSESLYSQAESLLLEELGLKDFKPRYKKTYTAKLSDTFSAYRIDAEYFQPVYEEILSTVSKKHRIEFLKKIFDFRRGIFISTDYYTEEKTSRPYIRIKELTGKTGIDESKIIYIKDNYPIDEANSLQENDIVIAIIGDTIGKTNRIYKELSGGFCSNNTGRLRIKKELNKEIIPEYAEILFQSVIIQSQIEKKKTQTGQPKISDKEIKSILIPILPLSTQQQIASLVQKSHETRKKAKELLEIAKKAIEIAIEKNEKEALDYISKSEEK
ncbi:restriction endonuclease subunit S [Thermodesulfovibrio sp. 3907-1M]|uniref:Restriction endonuclease subunit S n=1 Tax=Thermodesulfovibrio autotrophicus TaxID=3118333 RepID=A0AAU8GZG7_9BACT